MRLANIDQIH